MGNPEKMGFFKCFKRLYLSAKTVQADREPLLVRGGIAMDAEQGTIVNIGGYLCMAVEGEKDNLRSFQVIRRSNEEGSVNIEDEEHAGDPNMDDEGSNEPFEREMPESSEEDDVEEDKEEERPLRELEFEVDPVAWEGMAILGRIQDEVVEEKIEEMYLIHVPDFLTVGHVQTKVDIDALSGPISLVSARYGEHSCNFIRRGFC